MVRLLVALIIVGAVLFVFNAAFPFGQSGSPAPAGPPTPRTPNPSEGPGSFGHGNLP